MPANTLPYPTQVGGNLGEFPCVVCSKANASSLGLTDDLVATASKFEHPNFVANFPKTVSQIPDGVFQPVPGHFAVKSVDRIIDSTLQWNLGTKGAVPTNQVQFSFEAYAQLVNLLRK